MVDLELTPPLFAILSGLIEERVGLCYTLQDRDILASKLSLRALDLGFGSLLDYYYFLRYDPQSDAEFANLVNALVVNETFFFREFGALSAMVTNVLEPIAAAGRAPRVWCAACSSGEEPLTLAMLLEERGLLHRVEVIASDISSGALARARSGKFSRRSLRQVPEPALVQKWLTVTEHAVEVSPVLLAAISWRQVNLLDRAAVTAVGPVDLILCRNVLIYFRDATAARVVHLLTEQLLPDGVLLVGVSESLMRMGTSLVCEETAGVFSYRKRSQ